MNATSILSSPKQETEAKMKASQSVLLMIWLCGFLLILVSFYATTNMIPHSFNYTDSSVPLKITIFTALAASIHSNHSLALKSWLALSPDLTVVVFTQDPSLFSFASDWAPRVSVQPDIDFTFLGTPFFHSMVTRAQASTSDVSVLVDPDVILLPDFISTLNHVTKLDHDWLLVSSSTNLSYLPFHFDSDGECWVTDYGKRVTPEKLQAFHDPKRQWEQCGENNKMLMAWNNGDLPLHNGVLPPFVYGKGIHNRWIINEAMSSDFRLLIDASGTISNFYLNDLDHLFENGSWENEGNSHLGAIYGSLYFHKPNYSDMIKLIHCDGRHILYNTKEEVVFPFGHQRALSIRKDHVSTKILKCIDTIKSFERTKECNVKNKLKLSTSLYLPFSLKMLLELRADENKTIVLATAGYSYKDMLMSWMCRLRQLHISNFIVCALDDETYEFSLLQGLPVFKDSSAPNNISFDECHFGTECFQRVTKVKSRIVLQILRLGYNVLLSDVDVYWFKNPIPLLNSFGPAVLVAQSDEFNITGPINLPRRLNSGFYYAHSDISTITALDKVVKHAAKSNLSEQPSFYDTLCGVSGSQRVGDNKCLEPETNLLVHFLDRELFPNGAYKELWYKKDVKKICEKNGCFVLHNNWVSGRRKKLERQVLSGLWEYDVSTRMCIHSWQKNKTLNYF